MGIHYFPSCRYARVKQACNSSLLIGAVSRSNNGYDEGQISGWRSISFFYFLSKFRQGEGNKVYSGYRENKRNKGSINICETRRYYQ